MGNRLRDRICAGSAIVAEVMLSPLCCLCIVLWWALIAIIVLSVVNGMEDDVGRICENPRCPHQRDGWRMVHAVWVEKLRRTIMMCDDCRRRYERNRGSSSIFSKNMLDD